MPFEFDRYINGQLMAEGVTIERQHNIEDAMRVAARIASRGPNGETPVLVLHSEALSRTGAVKVDLEPLFRELEGTDTNQPGYHHDKGWNAALLYIMDLQRALEPAAPEGRQEAVWLLEPEDVAALKNASLKPEEIDGDDAIQIQRVHELLRWFARYTRGNANGKWLIAHAMELAFYIATKDARSQINIEELRKAAWYDGLSEPPEVREMAIRHGWITPKPGVAATRPTEQVVTEAMVKAAYLKGRGEWIPAGILADKERTERDWQKAKAAMEADHV